MLHHHAGPRGGRLHNERIRAMRERILLSVFCARLCLRSAMLARLCSRSCRPNSFACCQEFNCLSPMASVSLVQTSPPRSEPFLGVYCGRLCRPMASVSLVQRAMHKGVRRAQGCQKTRLSPPGQCRSQQLTQCQCHSDTSVVLVLHDNACILHLLRKLSSSLL